MLDPSNFQHFLEASPLPMWVYEIETLQFVWANQAAVNHYGYSLAEFRGMTILDIRPAEARPEVTMLARSEDRIGANKSRLWQHLTKDGTMLDVRVATVDLLPSGCGLRLALVEDVSSFTSMTHALEHMAKHDAATGLLNPQALAHLLDGGLLGARYEIAALRLHGLTEISDLFGSSVALAVAKEAISFLGNGRTGELWGFQPPNCILVASAHGEDLRELVVRAGDFLEKPVRAEGGQWQVYLRCGLSRFPHDGRRAEQIIACAGLAARSRGTESNPSSPSVYTEALGERSRRRRWLAVELRRAIRGEEIEVYFQPIVPAVDNGNGGGSRKYEALSRWKLNGEPVQPTEFIPIVESVGLSKELLRLIMKRSFEVISIHRKHGLDCLVTINVPAIASVLADLPSELLEISELHGLRPDCIGIEVTESALIDDAAHWRKSFAVLRYMGVHVAIDDFGTGFNSLSYLDLLPADVIKLDRTFIGQISLNDRQALICASIIRLAHGLGLKVVAEGVENDEQRKWLLKHGCNEFQGYLIGRPMTFAQVLDSLLADAGHEGELTNDAAWHP
ncbi:EAL domain-containing protein [Stenotrophomonas acidaminiphila]|uniref:EAL domain-containing protein n=1 Tax=Stenotrophomonas acidaminiphila TaxID=128780 RepID=UPI003D092C7A